MIPAAAIWAAPWQGAPRPGGALQIAGGTISAITDRPAGGDLLLMPGLVNAHDHGRGLLPLSYGAPDAPLETWLWDLWRAPPVDVWLSHVVAFAEMALAGVTTVVHNHLPQGPDLVAEAIAVARAARDVGLRLAMVVPVIDRNLAGYDGGAAAMAALSPDERNALAAAQALPPLADQIAAVEAIAAAIDGPDAVTQYGPPGPQWLSREGWAMVGAAAAQGGRRIHTHLLETRPQRDWLDSEEPAGAAAFLDAAGVLGDRLTVAHGVWLRAGEIEALAAAGATLALNTGSNLRLASGQVDGAALARSGLSLGIGLDGMTLDDDADIWRELRLATHLLGPRGFATPGLPAATLVRAAFSTGARAFDGRPLPGLVAGGRADLVGLSVQAVAGDRIDMSDAALGAMALGRASRPAVRLVVAGGREIVRDGRLTGLDLPAARAELLAQARAAFAPPGWTHKARAATGRRLGAGP